jgi:hypothetical protein
LARYSFRTGGRAVLGLVGEARGGSWRGCGRARGLVGGRGRVRRGLGKVSGLVDSR